MVIPPLPDDGTQGYALEAKDLTVKFGDFTAVDHVNFQIKRGEIFGFLGSNGCGNDHNESADRLIRQRAKGKHGGLISPLRVVISKT